ncbi:hypothetical protein chiPu_0024376 [Chiloscyllium punctatum]|uniref:Uncharacterized protein n=1 Tax=Chiloscyllium punctatum TaxID=137246 RepID=A0A401TC12_CHIPU|nr:hypothetical protein [Chiloscyllium punctatum]
MCTATDREEERQVKGQTDRQLTPGDPPLSEGMTLHPQHPTHSTGHRDPCLVSAVLEGARCQSSGLVVFPEGSGFLQTAEMLKPSTPSPSHESSGGPGSDEGSEYYPHIIFVQNKARRDDFCPRNLKKMHTVIDKLMLHSHLKYKGNGV